VNGRKDCNRYDLTGQGFAIGPGGLLLAVLISVIGVGLQKNK
jgi:hypothetical protein